MHGQTGSLDYIKSNASILCISDRIGAGVKCSIRRRNALYQQQNLAENRPEPQASRFTDGKFQS